ncbi:hypothetical protein D3C80_1741800 [compost metagenome]
MGLVTEKIELHIACLVRRDRHHVTARTQHSGVTAQVIGTQLDTLFIGFHIDDHAGLKALELAGSRQRSSTDCQRTVQVDPAQPGIIEC